MLRRLVVSNIAIVERAEVEFGPGLNVITGETGAGKSVLMGALELVLGGLTTVSTDFWEMGRLAADMITGHKLGKLRCPFRMIRRHTF